MAATVAPPPVATSMVARVDRLDLLLGYLEEMTATMHQNQQHRSSATTTATSSSSSPRACLAVPGGGSDGDEAAASTGSTPRRRPSCRSAKEALQEAQAKGSLIDRIAFLEDRLLRMEEDMVEATMVITPSASDTKIKAVVHDRRRCDDDGRHRTIRSNKKIKGLKSLVKSCVPGNLNTKE
ncbi:hypothetical protein BS78_08G172300 [Paspalum vaginatum]|nr:hypothetical protein BS78_08G172300 [Paspalum vaginatum]